MGGYWVHSGETEDQFPDHPPTRQGDVSLTMLVSSASCSAVASASQAFTSNTV